MTGSVLRAGCDWSHGWCFIYPDGSHDPVWRLKWIDVQSRLKDGTLREWVETEAAIWAITG